MTFEAAFNTFWNSFGIPAYLLHADGAQGREYIVYEQTLPDHMEMASLTVNVFYKSDTDIEINKKIREIESRITIGGVMIPIDGGGIWIKKGSPFCLYTSDLADEGWKRRTLNINIERI